MEEAGHFACSRINRTTFVIHENDEFKEHPFIYVKSYEKIPVIVLSDTGCGSGSKESPKPRDLRTFLETHPVAANGSQPLNPQDSNGNPRKKYVVICTHCHYDHILGVPQFREASPEIVAAQGGKSFIETDLPKHSLCKALGIDTPQYEITRWAQDYETLSFEGKSLGLQIIHTPGHTPDELAWYDQEERHLYVGDSFYERVAQDKSYKQAILFPEAGSIIDYVKSLDKLLDFIEAKNSYDDAHKGPLRVGCGHVTSSVDAREILLDVRRLFSDILAERIPVIHRKEKRGEEFWIWREEGEPRFSVEAPKRIVLEAQQSLLKNATK